jgi:hypothetical protein
MGTPSPSPLPRPPFVMILVVSNQKDHHLFHTHFLFAPKMQFLTCFQQKGSLTLVKIKDLPLSSLICVWGLHASFSQLLACVQFWVGV